MKLAYLITAHIDPKKLRRLIEALNKDADFYVHIDQKQNITPFTNELSPLKNVFFSERIFINWGGFGQIISLKELLKSVFDSNIKYDRIIFISGTDYPIWSNSKIVNEFETNKDKEYIMGLNLTKGTIKAQHDRISLYHFFRDIKVKNTLLKKAFSGTARNIFRIIPIRKKLTVLFDSKQVDVYTGSDFWALTYDCAKYLYEKMCTEKKLMKYFQTSFASSELVPPTIIFNSPFAKNAILIEGEYKDLESLTPFHYIEYSAAIKVFTEPDYDTLLNSGKMFFRKAITGKSDKLLDKIDLLRNN